MKKLFSYFLSILLFCSCQKELHFDSIVIAPLSKAVFTLQGAPDSCTGAQVAGNYIKSTSLNASNTATIHINVTTGGSYTISTNTVNGYKFSDSGSVSTGLQTLTLGGSGTPLTNGINVFTVTAGSSSCTFSVLVANPPVLGVFGNYFPITTNSFWTYDDLFNTGDSVKRYVDDSTHVNGNFYKIMEEQQMFGSPLQYFFRRDDTAYYEYASVDKYTVSMKFSPQIKSDLPFLKDNLVSGQTWYSDEFIGPASFGQTIFLRYFFTCDDANATVTLNGRTFTNVYKISMRPQIRSATTYPYNSTGELRLLYYAKDVGLIYTKATDQSFVLIEWQLKNWHVN